VLAEKLEPLYAAEAKERQREAGKQYGRGKEKVPQKVAEPKKNEGEARDKAAKAAKTNRQYVSDVKKINGKKPRQVARRRAAEGNASRQGWALGCVPGRTALRMYLAAVPVPVSSDVCAQGLPNCSPKKAMRYRSTDPKDSLN